MNDIKNKILLICFICTCPISALAQENIEITDKRGSNKWYKPDYFKIQYAGNIGFMSLGLGYEWWRNNAQSDFLYGIVPYDEGEAIIHTFTVKNTFTLYKFNLYHKFNVSPILGFSLSFEPGENSYMNVPEKYPKGYYGPNSFYACLNLGLKSNFILREDRYFSSIDVFAEMNTLADYVYYNFIAQEDRSNNIFSLAFGVNVFF